MVTQTSFIAVTFARVQERVALAAERAGRAAGEVTIVAVSKTFSVDAIRAAYDAGLRHFGENRVQEFEPKRAKLSDLGGVAWHFIGHLQSNKAHRAVHLFDRIDCVDSLSLSHKLDTAAATEHKRIPVLIEVRLSHEATKSGVAESDLRDLADYLSQSPHVDLCGLMTIPPYSDDPDEARPYFRRLRALRDRLREQLALPLPVLSMGMSHDFEVAIEEGATEIRVGTALFGKRG